MSDKQPSLSERLRSIPYDEMLRDDGPASKTCTEAADVIDRLTAKCADLQAKLNQQADVTEQAFVAMNRNADLGQAAEAEVAALKAQEPVAWLHQYKRTGGGGRYQQADLGDGHGPDPKDGYKWYRKDPLFASPVPPAPASNQATARDSEQIGVDSAPAQKEPGLTITREALIDLIPEFADAMLAAAQKEASNAGDN